MWMSINLERKCQYSMIHGEPLVLKSTESRQFGLQPHSGTESCPVLHCSLIVSCHFLSLGFNFLVKAGAWIRSSLSLLQFFSVPSYTQIFSTCIIKTQKIVVAKSLSLKQALSSLRWKHRSGLWLLSRKLAFLDHPISKSSPTTLNLIPIHQGVPDSK